MLGKLGTEGAMNQHKRLAALFLILALVGCAPVATGQGQGQAPYGPYSHEDTGNMDRGPDM
jgi:hypothetical protein